MTTGLIKWALLMILIGIGIGITATICIAVILAKRQEKIEDAEIEVYWRNKLRDDFIKGAFMKGAGSYYGFGGPHYRLEAAKERREQGLENLKDFERKLRKATKHIKTTVYAFGCGKCGAVCMTTKAPFNGWHECPTCRQMINLRNVSSHTIEIAEDSTEAWQEMLKDSLEEGK